MSSTKDLLNQIAVLTDAINRHKRQNNLSNNTLNNNSISTTPSYYDSKYKGGKYSKAYYKPSKNVTLINKNSSTSSLASNSSLESSSALPTGTSNQPEKNDLYIKKGNKLIRLEEIKKKKENSLLSIKKQNEGSFIRKRYQLINKEVLKKMSKPLKNDTVASVKKLAPGEFATILGVKYQKSLDGRKLTAYKPPIKKTLKINGIEFTLNPSGTKFLRKITDTNKAKITPKIVQYNKELYYRTKSGNLTKNIKEKGKINRSNKLVNPSLVGYCSYFIRFGKCQKPKCKYIHDPERISLCPRFLKGECSDTSCSLDHSKKPEKLPLCVHFLHGTCSNDNCPYVHIKMSANTPICKAFSLEGYCEKGRGCSERHLYQCPEFSLTGKCTNNKCTLLHVNSQTNDRNKRMGSLTSDKDRKGKFSEMSNRHNESSNTASSTTTSSKQKQELSIKPNFLKMHQKKEVENKEEQIILFNDNEDINEIIFGNQSPKTTTMDLDNKNNRTGVSDNEEEEDDDDDVESEDESEDEETINNNNDDDVEMESIDVGLLLNENEDDE